jgi:hypothetical protein
MEFDRDLAREFSSPVDSSDWRRLRVSLALRAVEAALCLLDPAPAEGLEIRALERVRDDLEVVLRIDEIERQL